MGNKDTDASHFQLLQGLPQLQRTTSPEALFFLSQPTCGEQILPQIPIQVILKGNGENSKCKWVHTWKSECGRILTRNWEGDSWNPFIQHGRWTSLPAREQDMNFLYFTKKLKTSTTGQDGGMARYMCSQTTKRKTTTNLKTKNNQNYQDVELYGSPTTKELKKKHSFRLVGGADTGSWAERTTARRWMVDQVVPHLRADNWEEQPGSETDHTAQGSTAGK